MRALPAPPAAAHALSPVLSTDSTDEAAAAVRGFLAALVEDHVAPRSARLYAAHLARFAAWLGERYGAGLLDATGHDLREYRAQLAARQKPASVNGALAALRRFYRWATAAGRARADPTARVKPVPAQSLAPKGFAPAERQRLRREAERAGVEGALSQGTRAFGLRRCRYTGLPKTRLQHLATAAAMNLARLDAWWTETPRAPTRCSAFARLALAG
jgi:nitroreductase